MNEAPVGNLTAEPSTTYKYDAENRLVDYQNGSATYTYDHASLRVKKVSGSATTVYIFSGAKVIAEYMNGAAPSAPTREYVDSGQVFAVHQSGTVKYHVRDHLSIRVTVDTSGAITSRHGHYPFGEVWYGQGPRWKFTSYERDDESGLDYAVFRSYGNRMGRFVTTDLLAGSIWRPQSLNRYAYVSDDPVNFIDPLGLCDIWVAATNTCVGILGTLPGFGRPSHAPLLDTGVEAHGGGGGYRFSDRDLEILDQLGVSIICPPVPPHPSNASVNANIAVTANEWDQFASSPASTPG